LQACSLALEHSEKLFQTGILVSLVYHPAEPMELDHDGFSVCPSPGPAIEGVHSQFEVFLEMFAPA
jgi:hypothetical protein